MLAGDTIPTRQILKSGMGRAFDSQKQYPQANVGTARQTPSAKRRIITMIIFGHDEERIYRGDAASLRPLRSPLDPAIFRRSDQMPRVQKSVLEQAAGPRARRRQAAEGGTRCRNI
jgi:hypothetical protein